MPYQPIVAHIPGLRRYARALTGDAWAADDLVQDTLERACSRWRLWLAGSDLRAWLFTLMHNLFISQLRQVQRQSPEPPLELEAVAHSLAAEGPVPGSSLDLQRCLLRLPLEQRAVLLLVCMEEMGYAEVARVLGVPLGTVMSRLSRARARMRELLEEPAHAAAPTVAPALRRLK